ncbi:MAG: type II toxin-antitoxin system HicB family antitoxin [Candidatus Hatepunaea meridiana]|nr:type II toxin-antitoxin system HicB family antitoxin [Candidatus Hatepunaea meridiana]
MDILENYTAHYVKIENGYMAQLVEWPDVVTEGKDIDDARESLRDATREMILAYKEKGWELPKGSAQFEVLPMAVG